MRVEEFSLCLRETFASPQLRILFGFSLKARRKRKKFLHPSSLPSMSYEAEKENSNMFYFTFLHTQKLRVQISLLLPFNLKPEIYQEQLCTVEGLSRRRERLVS
jgi:hypothetical protein